MNALPTPLNVSNITSRPDNLHDAVDLLHEAQITGDYRYNALALAGPLMSEVGKIFHLHMVLIFLTTSYKKRQVWLAYISSVYANPENPQPVTNPEAVRHKLMYASSKELLLEAYGSIPDGFLSALKRLGTDGQEPQVYLLLHQFMSASPEHRKSFSHASVIKASTVTTLAKLPLPLQSYGLAEQIADPKDIKPLTFIIKTLSRGDEAKYAEICSDVVKAAERKHSISAVLKREYSNVPFPKPLLSNTEFCKHIGNAFELKKAAHQFRNCLKDYIPEVLRREIFYHRWYEAGRPVAIISVREDAPFGNRLVEIKGKKNEYLDDELESKIIKHFESHGILKQPSMEQSLNLLSAAFNSDHRNFSEDIDDFIDNLLDEDNQI